MASNSAFGRTEKDEKVGLLAKSRDANTEPRLMRLLDVPRAVGTSVETLEGGDPVYRYVSSTPDRRFERLRSLWRRFTYAIMWILFVSRRQAWTIESGSSNLGFADPLLRPGFFGKIVNFFHERIYIMGKIFNTKQQNKRYDEFRIKYGQAMEREVGDRMDTMLVLDTIATTPSKQGHGYGSALARVLNAKADAEKRATVLVSSNVKVNTGFYNSLGFQTVATIYLGDDPDWHEEPVPVAIMVREPKGADS